MYCECWYKISKEDFEKIKVDGRRGIALYMKDENEVEEPANMKLVHVVVQDEDRCYLHKILIYVDHKSSEEQLYLYEYEVDSSD